MLQAHSLLWHYLWVAPNVLLLVLTFLLWCRGSLKQYPAFLAFAVGEAVVQLTLYTTDLTPWVVDRNWWKIFWVGLLVEALLKFALIGEILANVLGPYPSLAKLGKFLARGTGVALVLVASVAAAYAPKDNPDWLISGGHVLEQTIYLIESGELVFLFVFAAYFHLTLRRPVLGIALGLSISACVHLATWAILANWELKAVQRSPLDFLNMATYHACVLIWCYYLLVPSKVAVKSIGPLPPNNLDVWNQELERFLHP